jgi:signal transduction histidine kinase
MRASRLNWTLLAAWLILVFGTGLSFVTWRYLHEQAMRDASVAFEEQSREARRFIESRLDRYSALLFGMRGLHAVGTGLSEDSVQDYLEVLELPRQFAAVQRVQFETLEADGSRRAASFLPSGRLIQGPMVHALFDGPASGLAMESRDSGDLVASAVLPPAAAAAVLPMVLALYRPKLPLDSTALRRSAYRGLVCIEVSMGALVNEALSPRALGNMRTRLHLIGRTAQGADVPVEPIDPDRPIEGRLLLDTATLAPADWQDISPLGVSPAMFQSRSTIRFGGALLGMSFSAPASVFVHPTVQALTVLALLAGLVISLLLFGLFNSLATSREWLQSAVAARTRDLQTVNAELREEVEARNELEREVFHLNVRERHHMGAELREGIGSRLEGVLAGLDELTQGLTRRGHQASEQSSNIAGHVRTALEQTRMLALGLSPVAVRADDFVNALQRLALDTRSAFRVDCQVMEDAGSADGHGRNGGCAPPPDNPMLLHNLYRIVQQAITNAVTHGRATVIEVRLSLGDGLRLQILDNGIGWQGVAAPASRGIGLAIMRYRCAVLGLSFRMEPAPVLGGAAIIVEQKSTRANT